MDSVDIEVLRDTVAWLKSGQKVTLVTVVKTWGSAPRSPGAMLAVRADGRFIGSVSGGCVEDDVVERVRVHFPTRPQVVTYGVTGEDARRFGLPCGGTLQLVLEPVQDAGSLAEVLQAIEARRIVTRTLDMQTGGSVVSPAKASEALKFDGATLTTVHGPRWRLLLIGAGQLSAYLARFAMALDYGVIVCDPRAEYADAWDVPGTTLMGGMPDDVVKELALDVRSAVIALTHDPKLDDMALMEALKSDAFYVGALGSKANSDKRRQRLTQLDLTPAQVDRLKGPVGLAIGSRKPPEIAVAILAEITALRNGVELGPVAVKEQQAPSRRVRKAS